MPLLAARALVLLAVLSVLLSGCGPTTLPGPPASATPADPTATGSTSSSGPRAPHPRPVTRAKAGLVLRDLDPLAGFGAAAYCLDGTSRRCRLPGNPVWTKYAEWRGPRLGHGRAGRDAPRAFYLVGVLAHHDARVARSLVGTVSRRSPGGLLSEPVRVSDGGRSYAYGRRGAATLRAARVRDWSGVVSVSRVDLLRPHERAVHDVVQVDSTLHRGRVSVQVIGWLDGAAAGPDPAVRLDVLTQRVLALLDSAYAVVLREVDGD